MRTLTGLLILAAVASGQEYRRHTFQLDAGAARPRGELRGLFTASPLFGVSHGYRFHEFFQADVGFDTVFGAADVRDFLPSYFGDLRIRDFQHFLPFGARAILPLGTERVHLYGGGGGVYMRYAERLRQPFTDGTIRFPCDVCTSRNGIGYYGIVGFNFALDQAQHFRVGVGGRVIRGTTDGEPFGPIPARETQDRWINLFGSFSFSF